MKNKEIQDEALLQNDLITSFVFVYSKGKKFKVLNIVGAKIAHNELIQNGWSHIETLDACAYIKFMFEKVAENENSTRTH